MLAKQQHKIQTHTILIIILIICIAIILRVHLIGQYPHPNQTADELTYIWSGLSILQTGQPIGWSWRDVYTQQHRNITYQLAQDHNLTINTTQTMPTLIFEHNQYALVTPWFEAPPLFSIGLGIFALLHPQKMFSFSLEYLRLFPVVLSIITLLIVYGLTTTLFNIKTAYLASFLYATTPLIVLTNRLIVTENLVTPLLLGSLWLGILYQKTQQSKYLYTASILAGLCLLTKISGGSAIVMLGILFLYNKRALITHLAISSISILLLFLWGWLFNIQLFIASLLTHGQRLEIGVRHFIEQSIFGNVVSEPFVSGFILLGWISILARNTDLGMQKMLYPFLSYYVTILLLVGMFLFPWYAIPLYPIFCIAIAHYIMDSFDKKSSSALIICIITLILIDTAGIFSLIPGQWGMWIFRISIVMIILAIWMCSMNKKIFTLTLNGILILHILINALILIFLPITYQSLLQ